MKLTLTLTFLVADGACTVTFTPALTPFQYQDLVDLVDEFDNCDDMTRAVKEWVRDFKLNATFEE